MKVTIIKGKRAGVIGEIRGDLDKRNKQASDCGQRAKMIVRYKEGKGALTMWVIILSGKRRGVSGQIRGDLDKRIAQAKQFGQRAKMIVRYKEGSQHKRAWEYGDNLRAMTMMELALMEDGK